MLLLIFANNIDKAGGVRDNDFNHIGAGETRAFIMAKVCAMAFEGAWKYVFCFTFSLMVVFFFGLANP